MSCEPADYATVVESLLDSAARHRQPASGTFELTSRCNLSCSMCYVRHAGHDRSARTRELPAEAWVNMARQATDNGMVFMLITGGEVFVRKDFFEIYEPLTKLGLLIRLFTNGTLVTNRVAERLAFAPPNLTSITLYGATAATYEAVTGVSGSYARCCAGIEALLAHGIPLGLKATITRQNLGELEVMRQMARDWGLGFSANGLLTKRIDGTHSDVDTCRISAGDCVAVEGADRKPATNSAYERRSSGALDDVGNFFCRAGKASFHINAVGEMSVCMDMTEPAAKPQEVGFAKAWASVQHFVDTVPAAASECFSCSARKHCPRCPAWSLLETGTMTEPVPYLCEIARARRNRHDP